MNKTEEKYARQRNVSAACSMMRCDECTQRGFDHYTDPYQSVKDRTPCKCICGHKPTARMIELDLYINVPGWLPYYVR